MSEIENIDDALHYMQKNLVAPKSKRNNFGEFNYRNAEDILEAAKKIMPVGCTLRITDTVEYVGKRHYVKSSASLTFNGEYITAIGWAREPKLKTKFDESQITGASSSYAKKYALGNLFAIDDGVDDDSLAGKKENKKEEALTDEAKTKIMAKKIVAEIALCKTEKECLDLLDRNQTQIMTLQQANIKTAKWVQDKYQARLKEIKGA